MAIPAEQEIEAADLAAEVGALAVRGTARAHYAAGAWVMKAYSAPRILVISVTNADLDRRPPAERDALLARIAEAGAAWLRRRGLLVAGTLVSVSLVREVDLHVVSWARSVRGAAYWVDDAGALTSQRPSDDAEEPG
jgi:hypothetical protein